MKMRRETQNPLISSQILSPFAEQSSLASNKICFFNLWQGSFSDSSNLSSLAACSSHDRE
jgi:hypothetical protein